MRQLYLSQQHADPAWDADRARAMPLLRRLAAAHPLGLAFAAKEQLLPFIISVATQHRGQGAGWEELLTAGYTGAMHCYATCADPARWMSWWVREAIVRAASTII